ncbi:type I polyketide synthase [Dactylosporangium sp. CA-139066]|uniref:type I polyketide synthase n=1 Tax=Dactylosporangium sp. CA-139066 TaxID=3239930 RepID=UPI003D8DDA89
MSGIAIVGLGCRFPEAATPEELWGNVVASRRAFRRLPAERTRLEDYWAADPGAPDRFYARYAAVIEGYAFDRVRFKVPGSTYRSTDLTHWLALDTAADALADAGFSDGDGLPRERTAVVVGNTLTGEFTRTNVMRLRWPYVRRVLGAQLREEGWDDERLAGFLGRLEERYKAPFPPVTEDTLAGALSNTIAGRICNQLDLKGGGYTVDGACSSSLLSVVTACRSLADGDADVVVAGGVDLSIDPFEIVGFAKAGALATGEMRVYDARACGFWPGEGCGMVVLMREEDAVAAGRRVYASVAGWGISSDGRGGMTRPELAGYRLALQRAYERAGFGIDTVPVFEGHGTGTAVGDTTELRALSQARRAAGGTRTPPAPAAIGSVKALIGHTKAAAGVAGLIKATLAVYHRVVPPTPGCEQPNAELTGEGAVLRAVPRPEPWPAGAPVRAGVTAMGFGGINTHLVLEGAPGADPVTGGALDVRTQDAELLLVDADDEAGLRARLSELAGAAAGLSYGQLGDLAAQLSDRLAGRPWRAAVVARSPEEAQRRLGAAAAGGQACDPDGGLVVHRVDKPARAAFLFPGQGSGRGVSGGALRRRFRAAGDVYARAALPSGRDTVATEVAQPRIVTGSTAALRVLDELGVRASAAAGHSLGELTALHWAGAVDAPGLLRIASVRGAAMAASEEAGAMAGLAAGPDAVRALIGAEPVVIAGYNGPRQTVVAGAEAAVQRVCRSASATGVETTPLAVSHAFHSPLMRPAARRFGTWLAGERFAPLRAPVLSTVTGEALAPTADLRELLRRQITEPVRFAAAVGALRGDADVLVEVGPGRVLTGLARRLVDIPVVATDTDDESLATFLTAVGTLWALGHPIEPGPLFADRRVRPLDLEATPRYLTNPCEAAPEDLVEAAAAEPGAQDVPAGGGPGGDADVLEVVRRIAAERAELPLAAVRAETRPLDELHLSSIAVGQLVNEAARTLGLPAVQAPLNFATATIDELAQALRGSAGERHEPADPDAVPGAVPWVRPFTVELVAEPLPGGARTAEPDPDGSWRVYAPPEHPFAGLLGLALDNAGLGAGILVCLPDDCQDADLDMMVHAAREAMAQSLPARLVVVQHGRGAAGLAKTARLEAPGLRTTVIDTPFVPDLLQRVVAEVAATTTFAEAHYDEEGVRRVPQLRTLPRDLPPSAAAPLGPGDVLLVTGGGKGITAECALDLAAGGAALAILGRSDPGEDAELAANLERMRAAGRTVRYARADVTDPGAVRAAVLAVTAELGPVTAVLHGAGGNEPVPLPRLDPGAVRATLAPKVGGLRAVLSAVDPQRLRLLVTFGSIIARTGLHGEGHYAVANEWLADLTARLGRRLPHCRVLCLEWSLWSGVGMGERLSVVESLQRAGITPITPDEGVRVLREILAVRTPSVVVVSGRTGGLDTIGRERPGLPLLRFLERPLVHYAGIELVAEADLSPAHDPYLADHDLDGNLLVPAVLGLEAMAQTAGALLPGRGLPVVLDAEFARPVVVPPGGSTTVRIAAVATAADRVTVAVRSDETGFAVDHFRATLAFGACDAPPGDAPPPVPLSPAPLDAQRELYGPVLFQGRRFRRVRHYRRLAARHVEAGIACDEGVEWFNAFLPQHLVLGDPGARDAFMHALQVCVPDATLLPVAVARIEPAGPKLAAAERVTLSAVERGRDGDTYTYDVAVRDTLGTVVERWTGLRLRAVRKSDGRGPWVPALLGPFLQRRLEERFGAGIAVAAGPGTGPLDLEARRAATAAALGQALGRPVTVRHRGDGRPEVTGGPTVSAAHSAVLHLAVAAPGTVACDVEPVAPRPWSDLLGPRTALVEQLIAPGAESPDASATRVWCAVECLAKAGVPEPAPLTLVPGERADGWVLLRSGDLTIATFVCTLRDAGAPVALAVLSRRR